MARRRPDSLDGLNVPLHAAIGALTLAAPLVLGVVASKADISVRARGRVDFARRVPVTTSVDARVVSVRCREAETVVRGQVLVALDDLELRARRRELEERIAGLRARAAALREQRTLADVGDDRAAAELQRELEALRSIEGARRGAEAADERLLEHGAANPLAVAQARSDVEVAEARRRMREASLGALRARQEQERARLEGELEATEREAAALVAQLPVLEALIADATVRAPADGVILTADPGRLVGRRFDPGEPILQLADPGALEFVAEVDERDIGWVAAGESAVVTIDAFPYYVHRWFDGEVVRVASAPIDDAGHARYRAVLALRRPELELPIGGKLVTTPLRAGLAGEATIIVSRHVGLMAYLFRSLTRRLPSSFTLR